LVDTPDVSVIVIAYNDALRLPRAVQSALSQTHRALEVVIVDDCSTDDTFQVAQELAANHPGRVRAYSLETNSGGCSRPRNVGLEHARGEFVMFLDSDDELDRHAVKSLWEAAETTGADFSCGLTVRVHLSQKGRITKWYPHLYSAFEVVDGILAKPNLVNDPLSTNKCWRRSFLRDNGLSFPEGIHYEDQVFTTAAYLAASRMVLIPNRVYRWLVDDEAERRSISNQRKDFANVLDRFEVHRRIDAMYEAHGGLQELKLAKDIKFLRHDLRLYINDLPEHDEAWQQRFLEVAREYLATLDPQAPVLAGKMHEIGVLFIQQGDIPGLMTTSRFLTQRAKVAQPLVRRDGRLFWGPDYLDTAEGRLALDVTELGLEELPYRRFPFFHRLEELREEGNGVRFSGTSLDQLGGLDGAKLDLVFKPRWKLRSRRYVPLTDVVREDGTVRWTAHVNMTRAVRPLGLFDTIYDVSVRATRRRDVNTSPVTLDPGVAQQEHLPVRPRLTRLVADHFQIYATRNGNLALKLVALSVLTRLGIQGIRRLRRTWLGTWLERRFVAGLTWKRNLGSVQTRAKAYRRFMLRLPRRGGAVVFESHMGKQFSDSPRAIYEELVRRGYRGHITWSYDTSTDGFPQDVHLVKRLSWRYFLALARAEYWVDNQGFPGVVTKPSRVTYLQTWHGTALKHLGFDMPSIKRSGVTQQRHLQRMIDRWDYLCIRSPYDERSIADAYRSTAKRLPYGLPRNDVLLRTPAPDTSATRKALGLGTGDSRRILLYAPTFRQVDGKHQRFSMPFSLTRFQHELGDRFVLLVRAHYLDHISIAPELQGSVIDASGIHDVADLYPLADALITDYSSVMFDYCLLQRPIVIFGHDYDEYAGEERGTYFDLRTKSPGPFVETEEDLFETLRRLDEVSEHHAVALQAFREEFGLYDDGQAARRVVDAVFQDSLPKDGRA
jgi:CDP-glycerol glycerophosphotransferase